MLFKYLGPARIDVLQNLKVRFTQPCQLNDPFESALLVQLDALADFEAQMEDLARELVPETEEEFAQLEEAKANARAYTKSLLKPEAAGQSVANMINKAQGVLSLSRTNDSLLMWSHYGDSHKGLALGLDDSHDWFRVKNGLGNVTKPHNVVYTSVRSPVVADTEDFYERLLCYKSLEWAYEQEVRIFRTFGSSREEFEQNRPDQVHLFPVPKDCIKEIYIGANASAELRGQILEIVRAKRLDVKIFEAYIDHERYGLKFRPVEFEKAPPDYSQSESVDHYQPDMYMVLKVKP